MSSSAAVIRRRGGAIKRSAQRGQLLLWLLPLLLLSLSGLGVMPAASIVPMNVQLDAPVRALLAYAAHYPGLYQPRGAGPGHLPCPDSDGLAGAISGNAEAEGPNPPCAHGALIAGFLPRHIRFEGGRYAFHHVASRRIGYVVDGAVINNPLDRALSVRQPLGRDDAEVVVWLFSVEASAHTRLQAELALLAARLRRIESISSAREQVERQLARLAPYRLAVHRIRLGALRRAAMEWTDAWLRTRLQPWLDIGCGVAMSRDEGIALRWLRAPTPTSRCDLRDDVALQRLDAVPASRHWFVRNGWQQDYRIELQGPCAPLCRRRRGVL